jgi:NADPH-dependent ferric siderophore reductase
MPAVPPPPKKRAGVWSRKERDAWNLATRFRNEADQILLLFDHTAVPATNNAAERCRWTRSCQPCTNRALLALLDAAKHSGLHTNYEVRRVNAAVVAARDSADGIVAAINVFRLKYLKEAPCTA